MVRGRAARRPFFSALYFLLFDRSFWREQQAALCGQEFFRCGLTHTKGSSSLLRRSIHRIEKGLIAKPRRVPFALDYIEATVDVFASAASSKQGVNLPEIAWAHDVLTRYFDVHKDCQPLRLLAEQFDRCAINSLAPPADRAEVRVPYRRGDVRAPVCFDDFLSLCEIRRSVRWFRQIPVPRALLLKAMEAARLSPSACNRQPFRFYAFDEEPFRSVAANLPPGVSGFQHNFPVVIAVVGQMRYYEELRDRHLIYVDASLAVMTFVLALETLGLSSCCINWPDIDELESRASSALQLDRDERVVMFLAVGFAEPSGEVPYSEKVPADRLLRFVGCDDQGLSKTAGSAVLK